MVLTGSIRRRNAVSAVKDALAASRNAAQNPADHFADVSKMILVEKKRSPGDA
jgi:hypothetical protein